MYFERYAIAIEAGGRMRHQHLQGIADIRIKGDDQSFKALIKMLKQFVPMAVGSKATIQMKAHMAGQTFDLMLAITKRQDAAYAGSLLFILLDIQSTWIH